MYIRVGVVDRGGGCSLPGARLGQTTGPDSGRVPYRHSWIFYAPFCPMSANFGRADALQSPDGRQRIDMTLSDEDGAMRIGYATQFDGRPVILPSALDLTFDNHTRKLALGKPFTKIESRLRISLYSQS